MPARTPLALVAAALTLGAALALAGCGGHAATRAGVVARGNAICSAAQSEIRNVPAPSGTSLRALSTYLQRVLPAIEHEAAALRRLPRPAADRAQLTAFLAAERTSVAEERALAAAAAAGDPAAVNRALGMLQTATAPARAAAYGLSQCTGLQGTVR